MRPPPRGHGWAWVTAALLLLAACQTSPPDRVAQTVTGEDIAALDTFDLRLLDQRLAPDPAALRALRSELDHAAARPGTGRLVAARINALRAEAALLAGDTAGARRLVESAAGFSDAEEGVWIVRARLETDAAKRIAILEQGIARSGTRARLLCERGLALLDAARYAEAAQDLDEGLRGLDQRYRSLYGASRDKALALAQSVRDTGVSPARIDTLEGTLTARAMVERAFADTRLLAALSPDSRPSFDTALPAVKAAGLLLDPAAAPDAAVTRKEVAWFLWGIVARAEHDPKLLTRYRLKYAKSPVPDVAVTDPWFDSVLGVAEREIMELPDGVHFEPDGPVTGFAYAAMLAQLKKLYP